MPLPTRILDPHEQLPIPMNFSELSFLDDDPLETITSITDTDESPATVTPGTIVISNQDLDIENKKCVFDVAGGVDGQITVIEVILTTEGGRTPTGHVRIKWKEGASQEVQ